MGAIYDEFVAEMSALRQRYLGRPDLERRHLYRLALEREQLVAIAYGDAILRPRLATLAVPDDVRELIRHALAWLWRNEEMHAVFVRGTLLADTERLVGSRIVAHQALGTISGWTSALKQHVAPADAPLAHAFASVLVASGSVVGKLSPALREELSYRSFKSFCEFNVEAERQAANCWDRIVELTDDVDRPAFEQIAEDERDHGSVFGAFADALDARDQLRPRVTLETLVEKLRAVGDAYVPRRFRRVVSPIGSGAAVWVYEGTNVEDKQSVLRRVLTDAGLPALVDARAATSTPGSLGLRAVLKASFSLGYDIRDRSNVTDPEVLDELARLLRELGVTDVVVVEAPSLYDQFYDHRSVAEIAEYFGYSSDAYRIVDLSTDQVPHRFRRGLGSATVSATWRDADLRISVPKLRSHCTERVHLAVANLQGLSGRLEDFLFVEKRAHYPAATMAIVDEFPPHFALIDAYELAADGHWGVMACREPKAPLRFYAGEDALGVDRIAARDTGTLDPQQSEVLRTAFDWFGASYGPVATHGVSEPISPWRHPYRDEWSSFVSMLAYPIYVFGSGRGSLFVPKMDEVAFPPKGSPGPTLRAIRRMNATVLGLRPPR